MWIKFHTLCWCLLLIFGCTCANMDEQACVLYAWNICFITFLGFNTLKAFCHMPLTRWNKGQFCWTSWKNTVKVRIVCSAFQFPLLLFIMAFNLLQGILSFYCVLHLVSMLCFQLFIKNRKLSYCPSIVAFSLNMDAPNPWVEIVKSLTNPT